MYRFDPLMLAAQGYQESRLMTRYFPDAKFDEAERSKFAFASYNAGPSRIAKLRKLAIDRGLDGDQWFNNASTSWATSD
jgi:membrane-bound lytic murein transglycosylase MltF